jgi:hypothetical protein
LIRHQNIGQVWIHPGQTSVPLELQNHSLQKLHSHTSQQTSNSHLHKLTVLGGPSWYLVPLLAAIHPVDQGSQGSSPETKALGDLHSLVRQSTDTHSTAVVHHPLHHSTTRTHRLDPSSSW